MAVVGTCFIITVEHCCIGQYTAIEYYTEKTSPAVNTAVHSHTNTHYKTTCNYKY